MSDAIPEPKDRLSAAEIKARSLGKSANACPRCGCMDWRTVNSYVRADGTRRRQQYCRHCKKTRETIETPTTEGESE